jgi:hypothetical protein
MQATEFIQYINHFPHFKKHFKGIFSIDTLPKSLGYRKFLICNTDFQNGNGKHWIFFGQTEKNIIELFDSLGIDEQKKKLLYEYCKFDKEIIFNTTPFQDTNTSTCGLFVLYYFFERLFNLDLDFEELLNLIFDEDISKNEKTVVEFQKDFEKLV